MNAIVSIGLRKSPLEHRPALEAAHRLGFATVLITDEPPADLPAGLVAEVVAVDPHDTEHFHKALDEVAAARRPAAVVTWSDDGVEPAAEAAARLGLPGPSPEAARLARNKFRMRAAMSTAAPHLIPRFARVRTWDDAVRAAGEVGFPAVLKPAAGSGSKGIFQLEDRADLRGAFDALVRLTGSGGIFRRDPGDLVLEERLRGTEHSVEGFVHRGEVLIAGVTDKTTTEPHRLELAHVHPSALAPVVLDAVRDLTAVTVRALGLDDCAFHLECMVDPVDGPRLIEVAARAGGDFIASHLVGLASGVSFHENVIRTALGHRPLLPAGPGQYAGVRKILATEAGILQSVNGFDTALTVPGITDGTLLRHPGTTIRLPPDHYTASVIGALIAAGDAPSTVEATLTEATAAITLNIAT